MPPIYFDNAATTALDPEVLEAMMPWLTTNYGNPSSVHSLGRPARQAIEESRDTIAHLINAEPGEIIFTAGGTEANNTAINGILGNSSKGLITSAIEHKAILNPAKKLSISRAVTFLTPNDEGVISAGAVEKAITSETGLVSLMYVNNETGAINPISEIAKVCRDKNVILHTDAVQSASTIRLDVDQLDVDLLSISGHKFYGPKGSGFLYARGTNEIPSFIQGGSQERGRRAGTENVAGIVGLAKAFEMAQNNIASRSKHLKSLQIAFIADLLEKLPVEPLFNTPFHYNAAPHIVSFSLAPINGQAFDAEMLLLNLDVAGICAASGSACTSGAIKPSHVILGLGQEHDTAAATLRFSFGKQNTEEEVIKVVDQIVKIVTRMMP